MPGDNNKKFTEFTKKILKKIQPRFSFHYIAYTTLFIFVIFSVVSLATATTPNPGHPWSELGDGVFTVANTQTANRTYTFPDANATVLTTNALVTVAQGGTGVGTLTGIVKGNGTGAFSAATAGTDYQAPLVSGTNIKTINGSTVLGSGDLTINSMVYPSSGIPNSTGSAWGTSYSTSGSGTVLALATTPTFTTNITTPLILGGTSTTQDLSFQTTSGVGATGADMHFLVGNAGGTEAMTILNNGNVGVGTTGPTALFHTYKNANTDNSLWVENASSGTSAEAAIAVKNDVGAYLALEEFSSTYPTRGSAGSLTSSGSGGFYFYQYNNAGNITFSTTTSLTPRMTILNNGNVGIGNTNPSNKFEVITTLPTTTGIKQGFTLSVTGAGTLPTSLYGENINLNAGYTGSGDTYGFGALNMSAGTGSTWSDGSDGYGYRINSGNAGGFTMAVSTTTGTNTGLMAVAVGGNTNLGTFSSASNPKNGATNVGVAGFALNTGTSPIQVGGYFGLYKANNLPTFESSALIADNGGTTSPIFLARDNGTSVFSIIDGGKVGIGVTGPTAALHLKAGTATAGTAPLKFTSGTVLGTTEAGAVEYDGSHLYFTATNAGTRYQLDQQGGMVYPGAGIPNSTGSAWGTSYTTTGSGTVLALATTPTFTTNITTPLILGGTSTTQDLSFQTTSGVGATGADMHFLVGNAGGTEAMTILNNGNVGIGNNNPNGVLDITKSYTDVGQEIIRINPIYTYNTNGDYYNSVLDNYITLNGSANNTNAVTGISSTISNENTGNIISILGGFFSIDNTTTGTIGDAYGVVSDIRNSGGGVINNSYGVYIDRIEGTNRFGLYQNDTGAKNFFGGKLGLGEVSPTAVLHLKAGTATAGTAPLKFTSGTNLTTAEAGAMEWNGSSLFITQTSGPTRKTLAYTTDIPSVTGFVPYSGANSNVDLGTYSLTTPLVLGGSTTTSPLTFQTTSAAGTTGADMHFKVGNNGNLEALTILNNGNVGIGNTTPGDTLAVHNNTNANLTVSNSSAIGAVEAWDDYVGIGAYSNSRVYFLIGDANKAMLDVAGNFGVGLNGSDTNAVYRLNILNNTTAQTASNRVANFANTGATFNTTSGNLNSYGGYFSSLSTKSAGANTLTNVGLYATASGADNNYAAIFDQGNVGIGAITPNDGKLVLKQTGTTNSSGFTLLNSTESASARWYVDASNVQRIDNGSTANGNISLNGAGTGNVGIGTTGPGYKLDVAGYARLGNSNPGVSGYTLFTDTTFGHLYPGDSTARFSYDRNQNSSGGNSGSLIFNPSSQAGGSTIAQSGAGITQPGNGQLAFFNSNGTALAESMRILANGNVGIGTTNPLHRFTISGNLNDVNKQGFLSVDNQLVSSLEGGSYFGRTKLTENQWETSGNVINWTQSNSTNAFWTSIAMSSDGKIQSATAPSLAMTFYSNDYGVTWTQSNAGASLDGIAMSADGKIQTAVGAGYIYYSTDYGINWTQSNSISSGWISVAMSSDGKIQVAADSIGLIYYSTDYGINWTATVSPTSNWTDVAVSSDGKWVTATQNGGYIWYSTIDNLGGWNSPSIAKAWQSIAMSSDGKFQSAVANDFSAEYIYYSTDYGVTWTVSNSIATGWKDIAMSSDGKIQSAVDNNSGFIYYSTDYGVTWTASNSIAGVWTSIAMSSDGKIQSALDINSGFIYYSYSKSSTNGSVGIVKGNLDLDNTVAGNLAGVITKNNTPFIHDFNYGDNGVVTTPGQNIFIGENAGNFTMGSTATAAYESSYNIGIGNLSLNSDSTGYANTSIGNEALSNNTTGYLNSALGHYAGKYIADGITSNQTSNNSLYLGYNTRANADGDTNEIVIGNMAIGNGSNTATIGDTNLLRTYLTGVNLKAGTATAGTAPLKFTAGTNLGTTEAGAVEYDGSHLYFTASNGGTRYQLDQQSGGGLTVGTSAITSGTSGRVLYNNGGVLGEMTTTGSGTVLALATTPTFTTNITTPLVLGGTSTTADLSFQTTSGIGATGADMHFKVGNAGGTEAMTILNNGNVGINAVSPGYKLQVGGDSYLNGNVYSSGNIVSTVSGSYSSFDGISYSNTDWHGSRFGFNRARGVQGSALAVASGDSIGWFDYFGYDGATDQRVGQFTVTVDGTVSSGIVPGRFAIATASATGVNTTRLTAYSNDNIVMSTNGGKVGIGVASPTASLHLKAGTATANTAPLKFTSGVNLGTAETGAMEYDGTNLYFTPTGTTRKTIAYTDSNITGSANSLKSVATTGLLTVTGMGAGTTRAKTVRDADDTILELGGSYTPTGTWTSLKLNENVALTTTSTKLNYLTSATGTTGTTSTNLVFSTSPALTTPTVVTSIVGDATFAAFNTVTTNLSLGGAATTLTIGGTPTTAITHNYSTNATAAATTKTVNLGTGGAASSTTNINIGANAGGTTTINSPTLALGTGSLTMTGSVGSTGARLTKVWTTDLQTTNAPIIDSLTASRVVVSGASKELTSATTTTTQVNYLSGATGTTGTTTTNLVFSTSPTIVTPTFTTSITTPLVLGGTSTTQDLTLQTTSGVGAAGADMHFKVGNAGGIEAMTIMNDGKVGINNTNPTTHQLMINGSVQIGTGFNYTPSVTTDLTVGSGTQTSRFLFGQSNTAYGGMQWNYSATPSAGYLAVGLINGDGLKGFTIFQSGNIGVGNANPTALFHLKAGTATANSAPLKFTSGTVLGTTEAGAVEYDGSHLYFTATNGGTRYQLDQQGSGSQWTTATNDIYYNTGRVWIGSTTESTSQSRLALTGTNTYNGATAGVIGILGNYTFDNGGAANYVQVANRLVVTNSPTTNANTAVGETIRVVDSSGLANLVRGIDITANAGSNTSGINTGIRTVGATFGIQALTSGLGGSQSVPAAIYGENIASTAGDILRLYSTSVTTAPSFATFYHKTSTFSGTGLLMDFAESAGTFNGNYLDFQNNNTTVFKVTSAGLTSTGLGGTASTNAVCSSLANTIAPTAGVAYELRDCNAAPAADYAEMYPVENGIEFGDIVATGTDMVMTYDVTDGNIDWNKEKGKITKLIKSDKDYQRNVIGIVSDNYGDFSSTGNNIKDEDNPMPVALSGRVPVKVSSTSESIKAGDYITTSLDLGKATKATKAGFVIGKALESWDVSSGKNTVMVFVEQGYYNGPELTETTLSGLTFFEDDAQFIKNVVFNSQVEFTIPPVFNKDTAGFAIIKEGAKKVEITFENPYIAQPVVSANISFEDSDENNMTDEEADEFFGKGFTSLITNKTQNGFTIRINKNATRDIRFSWIALAVKDPQIFESVIDGLVIEDDTSLESSESTTTNNSTYETQPAAEVDAASLQSQEQTDPTTSMIDKIINSGIVQSIFGNSSIEYEATPEEVVNVNDSNNNNVNNNESNNENNQGNENKDVSNSSSSSDASSSAAGESSSVPSSDSATPSPSL